MKIKYPIKQYNYIFALYNIHIPYDMHYITSIYNCNIFTGYLTNLT